MRFTLSFCIAVALSGGIVAAHSWVECTNHDNAEVLQKMKDGAAKGELVDPVFFPEYCHGWPRAKKNPGDWIDESTNYAWILGTGEKNACNPSQRQPAQEGNAPMAKAKAGEMIRLRYGGNGHTRGANAGPDGPGLVEVYWAGKKETEITTVDEFTDDKRIGRAGFSDVSFSYPEGVTSPTEGLIDKGNWMELTLPDKMEAGRHMMVWVWRYDNKPQWSTCFDVEIEG